MLLLCTMSNYNSTEKYESTFLRLYYSLINLPKIYCLLKVCIPVIVCVIYKRINYSQKSVF